MKKFQNIIRTLFMMLLLIMLISPSMKIYAGTYSTIDYSTRAAANRVNMRGEPGFGDCAIASIASIEAYWANTTSGKYDEVYGLFNGVYISSWSKAGYTSQGYSLQTLYSALQSGPVIIHRTGGSGHYSVVVAYEGNTSNLEMSGFKVMEVQRYNRTDGSYGYPTRWNSDYNNATKVPLNVWGTYSSGSPNQICTRNASGDSSIAAYTITNQDYENLTETSVTIKAMLDKTTTNMSECGVYIGTSTSNMTQIRESVNVGTQVRYMSYGTQKWYGTLTPGTTYYYRFYAIIGGTTYWGDYGNFTTAGSPPDSQAPVISNIKCERISADTVKVSCTVTDNSQVTKVAFPVWTDANGQDDLNSSWNTECIGIQNGTTWSYLVKDSDHNYEKGKYIVHIYAWDNYGNQAFTGSEFDFSNLYRVIASVENGSRYELYDDVLTWEQAKAKCEKLGGHLVTITSEKEQKVVQDLVTKGCRDAYFSGGYRENGNSKWITGETFSYTNWASGQPDNWQDKENVYEIGNSGKWNDIPHDEPSRGFICEYDKEKIPVKRIYGQTRYDTSYKVADALLEQLGISQFNAVIVANGKTFPDALAGSSLAAQKNAPILMVNDENAAKLREYIKKNLKQNGTIYVLGGKAAVSDQVLSGLSGNYQMKRLSGSDRYATNLAILNQLSMNSGDILVCTGKNFADSLSASATGKPILLVGKSLTTQQKQFLNNHRGKRFYIIGGEGAVSKSIEAQIKTYGSCIRISGQTRYETSIAVAEAFFGQPKSAVVAYAKNFPDGLSGSSLAYAMKAPLILTMTGKENAAVKYTTARNIKEGVVLGGTKLISDNAAKKIFNVNKIGY